MIPIDGKRNIPSYKLKEFCGILLNIAIHISNAR